MARFFVWTATRKTAASTFLHIRPSSYSLSPTLTDISSATIETCRRELYSVQRSSRKNGKREEGGDPKALLYLFPSGHRGKRKMQGQNWKDCGVLIKAKDRSKKV